MSKSVQPWPISHVEDGSFEDWAKKKDDDKIGQDKLKLFELNRQIIENHLDTEKRRVINELCYLKWLEKKSKEFMEKKQSKLEEEKLKQEAAILALKTQMVKNLKFNEWLVKKKTEANKKREQMAMIKNEKDNENEMKRYEKQQADKVWKQWLEKKVQKAKEERTKKLKEEEEKQKEKEEKRKLSDKIFKEWLKKASNRPKPVRSNLGFASLSCTNIGYVNPIPWKTIESDTADSNKTLTVLYKKPSGIALDMDKSTSSIQFLEEDNCNSLQRTADWVKNASKQVVTKTKKSPNCVDADTTEDEDGVIRFGRNKSAPVFIEKKDRKS